MNKVRCRALAEIERSEEQGDDLVIFGVASAANLDRKGTYIDQNSLWDASKRYTHRTLYLNHDWNAAVGTVEELARGEDSLLAQARIGHNFEVPVSVGLGAVLWNVNNLRSQIRQRIIRGYSIGFEGTKRDGKDGDPPTIEVSDLVDISIVTLPANPSTLFGFNRSMIMDGSKPWPTWQYSQANGIHTITQPVSPMRFEFAPEEHVDEELEYLKVALRSLQEAVADWK